MEKIKLPRSSYDEIKKIIIAYGGLNRPVNLDDIAHATGMGRTIISANNAFLTIIEIIEGGNKKNVTQKGAKLSRSLEHEIQNEVEASWTQVINENDFFTKMLQAVKIRKGMDIAQLENHIAFSSGELKTSQVMTGARAVVDILISSGQLKQDGEKLIVNSSIQPTDTVVISSGSATGLQEPNSVEERVVPINLKSSSNLNLNIELKITASPDELEGLGKKIKAIIDELNEKD